MRDVPFIYFVVFVDARMCLGTDRVMFVRGQVASVVSSDGVAH